MEKQKKMALTEEEKSINIVDLFIYLIAHWKWFVLSILLFGDISGIATVRPRLYIAARQ